MSSKRKILSELLPVSLKVVGEIFKKDGWCFNWRGEYKKPDRHMFYLRTCTDDRRVQGLISATPTIDAKFIFLHLIEKAPHNMGAEKQYDFVPECLLAFMCKASFEMGFAGYVAFIAKSRLIDHYYKKYGADLIHPKQNKMCINSEML